MAKALGRKQNTGRNGFSRHTYVGVFYAPQAGRRGIIEQFPQDILADSSSVPSKVVIVRSDRGGRFRARNFGDLLCRSRGIMEELPMASSQSPIQWGSRARARVGRNGRNGGPKSGF